MVLSGKTGFWWIGLRAHGGQTGGVDYIWDNGQPLTYTHWDKEQPGTPTPERVGGGLGLLDVGASCKHRRVFVSRQRRRVLCGHGGGQDRWLLG